MFKIRKPFSVPDSLNRDLLAVFKQKNESTERLACTHDWNLISKTYAQPRKDITGGIANPLTLEKALFGLTTYLWECRACGELRKEELLGSDESQLQEIYEKIEKGGMQFLRDGENVYAITKWVPPAGEVVPLR